MADLTLFDVLVGALTLFFVVAFLWLYANLLLDLIRSHDLTGWGKAAWTVGMILFPLVGSMAYIVVRGSGIPGRYLENAPRHAVEQPPVVQSAASEVAQLVDLRNNGALSEAEFDQLKARLVASA